MNRFTVSVILLSTAVIVVLAMVIIPARCGTKKGQSMKEQNAPVSQPEYKYINIGSGKVINTADLQ